MGKHSPHLLSCLSVKSYGSVTSGHSRESISALKSQEQCCPAAVKFTSVTAHGEKGQQATAFPKSLAAIAAPFWWHHGSTPAAVEHCRHQQGEKKEILSWAD